MTREKLAEIFNETQEKFVKEDLTQEKVKEIISQYADENGQLTPAQMAIFAYIEGFKNSTNFMWQVLTKIVEYEEEQKSSEEA